MCSPVWSRIRTVETGEAELTRKPGRMRKEATCTLHTGAGVDTSNGNEHGFYHFLSFAAGTELGLELELASEILRVDSRTAVGPNATGREP
jgi:hypothetical protein